MYDHLESPFIEITTKVDTDTVGMMYRTPSSVIAHFKCDHKMILAKFVCLSIIFLQAQDGKSRVSTDTVQVSVYIFSTT